MARNPNQMAAKKLEAVVPRNWKPQQNVAPPAAAPAAAAAAEAWPSKQQLGRAMAVAMAANKRDGTDPMMEAALITLRSRVAVLDRAREAS